MVLHVALGGESLRNTAQVSLRNAMLATLINYFPSASCIPGNADRLEKTGTDLACSSRGSKTRGWMLTEEFVVTAFK